MNSSLTVSRRFRIQRQRHGRKALRGDSDHQELPSERVPRVARLMALAIHFEQLLRKGVVADQTQLTRLGHVSQLPPTQGGREHLSERELRPIAALAGWPRQRREWSALGRRGLVCPAESD